MASSSLSAPATPTRLVVQLLEGLEAAWKGLGESSEPGLHERVEALVEAWERPPRSDRFPGDDLPPLDERRCGHCGYDRAMLNGSVGGPHTSDFEAIPEPALSRQTSRLPSTMVVWLGRRRRCVVRPSRLGCAPPEMVVERLAKGGEAPAQPADVSSPSHFP